MDVIYDRLQHAPYTRPKIQPRTGVCQWFIVNATQLNLFHYNIHNRVWLFWFGVLWSRTHVLLLQVFKPVYRQLHYTVHGFSVQRLDLRTSVRSMLQSVIYDRHIAYYGWRIQPSQRLPPYLQIAVAPQQTPTFISLF
jgi:hypothetical protein